MSIGYIHFITSIFIRYQTFAVPKDLSALMVWRCALKGDSHHYKLIVQTSSEWDALGYTTAFDIVSGQWKSVET